ncbi:hypothetical protein COW94_00355 [Candidatus Peregrinibacteria bacterium CG22_combo_CG10-13_8_21_14_all_44_10]|nr:MAG: hypothetical protein AUK45_02520 [Candidatus Peregrinibacteria bacterium CG2_30_44_17]PIP66702.1 MAG: hypothetical protein COW94_00355 [Candidatus Peregrinibacteria bacterium CG22_combo_CG10-13_8_21_14_all_44_10]PIS03836.1 MAG: hypothetical protein COT83_03945 [Candidatus Peregrinibacteria bacterium CG10_big_fil_rev_8_21_14_0_10_44_7]PIX80651.1 MAG: hypothetical protein COZ35_00165 [Candidatus Peregrinibacteria bacterium CG_4_10_14_3_um_filter_44_21]PJB89679.1 MAG: hypothetical protein 
MVNEMPNKMDYGDDARTELSKLHMAIMGNEDLEETEKSKLIQATDEVIDAQREQSGREIQAFEEADASLFRDKFKQEQRELRALIISLTEGIDAQLAVASDFGSITDEEFAELYGEIDGLVPLREDEGNAYDRPEAEEWRRTKVKEGYNPTEVRESSVAMAGGGTITGYSPTAPDQARDALLWVRDTLLLTPGTEGTAEMMDALIFGEMARDVARKQYAAIGLTGADLERAVDISQKSFPQALKDDWSSAAVYLVSVMFAMLGGNVMKGILEHGILKLGLGSTLRPIFGNAVEKILSEAGEGGLEMIESEIKSRLEAE